MKYYVQSFKPLAINTRENSSRKDENFCCYENKKINKKVKEDAKTSSQPNENTIYK